MNAPGIDSITGVILAGGKSSRMGSDKAFARVGPHTLIERTARALRECFARTLVIAGRAEALAALELPVFPDDVPDLGPLGGIATALRRAETEAIFVVACDMPFLNPVLIRAMADARGDFDAVAVRVDGALEPLHAVYHRRLLPGIAERIEASDTSVFRLLESARVRIFTREDLDRFPGWEKTFFNVNTPDHLAQARQMEQDGGAHRD